MKINSVTDLPNGDASVEIEMTNEERTMLREFYGWKRLTHKRIQATREGFEKMEKDLAREQLRQLLKTSWLTKLKMKLFPKKYPDGKLGTISGITISDE